MRGGTGPENNESFGDDPATEVLPTEDHVGRSDGATARARDESDADSRAETPPADPATDEPATDEHSAIDEHSAVEESVAADAGMGDDSVRDDSVGDDSVTAPTALPTLDGPTTVAQRSVDAPGAEQVVEAPDADVSNPDPEASVDSDTTPAEAPASAPLPSDPQAQDATEHIAWSEASPAQAREDGRPGEGGDGRRGNEVDPAADTEAMSAATVAAGGAAAGRFRPGATDPNSSTPEPPSAEHPSAQHSSPQHPSSEHPSSEPPGAEPPGTEPPVARGGDGTPWWRGRGVLAAAAVLVLLVGVYLIDLLTSSGQVPRGAEVAGVDLAGLSQDDAAQRLREVVEPRLTETIPVRVAGDGDATESADASGDEAQPTGDASTASVVPADAGISVDWDATIDRIGSQPLNPFTRLASLFSKREIEPVVTVDEEALSGTVAELATTLDRPVVEGNVIFEGAIPRAVEPVNGQTLQSDASQDAILGNWYRGDSIDLPADVVESTVDSAAVARALNDIAVPAASIPVQVTGDNDVVGTLPVDRIGEVISFEPDGSGALQAHYNLASAQGLLAPQLAASEVQPTDARIEVGGGVSIVPAVDGNVVDWGATLERLPQMFAAPDPRVIEAVYEHKPPELTTEGAQNLGVREVIGEFTTGGFEYASGVNIGVGARAINQTLVKPGETFSLNEATGPRGTAQGYVESGIINNGRPARGVGGGVSQLATTTYNAAYFAGMEDVAHTEHSYYISRYPEAREATVFEGAIDLQFRNTYDTAVVVEAWANSSQVTVRLWGTKHVNVESYTGERSAYTTPRTITLPAGDGCVASSGAQGFTTSNTRVITDANSGAQISSNTRTVTYDPVPIVRCVSPEEPAAAPAEDAPAANEDDGES